MIETIILLKYQRQVRDICRQLSFLIKNESNMLVTGDVGFGGLKELMELLNQLLMSRKKEQKRHPYGLVQPLWQQDYHR